MAVTWAWRRKTPARVTPLAASSGGPPTESLSSKPSTPPHAARHRLFPFLVTLSLVAVAAGCHKKAATTAEMRVVTHDLVAAAQKVTGRRAEITIRPEMQTAAEGTHSRLAADHIYITLADPKQRAALEQALDEVARRYSLAHTSHSSTAEVVRWDYEKDGQRTHSIHVITPVAERPVRPITSGHGPELAIIIDDLGYDRPPADALLALPFPLTVSILPHLPYSADIAEEAHRRGDQVLLHLPMESASDAAKPESTELRAGMKQEEVTRLLEDMLQTVPHAVGINNHQGSRSTADPQLMAELMPALRQRNLFFIDSRTSVDTVAYDAAESAGVRAAYRNVQFLDDTPTRQAVLKQLELAESDAERKGWAIAIGHPHPATLAALEEALPRFRARGVRLVFASDLAR